MTRRLLAVTCVALFVVAACGGGGDDDTAAPTTSTAAPGTTTPPTAPPTTTGGTPPPTIGLVEVSLEEIVTLEAPTAMAVRSGDSSLYITEQEGRVRRIAVTRDDPDDPPEYDLVRSSVLDITDDVVAGGEQGLLGITFSPDGRRLYVAYTGLDERQYVDEFEMDGDDVDDSSRRNIFTVDDFAPNHNGGQVSFGPDGFLYYGMGDGGGAGDPSESGQNPSDFLGSLLRVDPETASDTLAYGIPAGNPFANGAGGAPEVYAYGLRNPWRFSFDRLNGDLWIGDVGQGDWEEIDYVAADGPARAGLGGDFGWDDVEGTHGFEADAPPEGAIPPIYEYSHNDGGCSVTGGYVYRGDAIPTLEGAYIFADYCQGYLFALRHDGGRVTDVRSIGTNVGTPSSFGEDQDGEIFVLDLGGTVYKLEPA